MNASILHGIAAVINALARLVRDLTIAACLFCPHTLPTDMTRTQIETASIADR